VRVKAFVTDGLRLRFAPGKNGILVRGTYIFGGDVVDVWSVVRLGNDIWIGVALFEFSSASWKIGFAAALCDGVVYFERV
jgi:hypothetical protein